MAATAHNWRGVFEEGMRNAREAAELFRRGSEPWNAALEQLAWASGATGNVEQLEAVAQSLLETTPVEGLKLNAVCARCITSSWFFSLGRYASASALSELLATIQPGSVEALLAARLHQWRSIAAAVSRQLEECLREAKAEASAFDHAGALRDACLARANWCAALNSVGMYSQAELVLQDVLLETERLGLPYLAAGAQIVRGTIYVVQGGSEEGCLLISKVAEEARARGNTYHEGQARVVLARVLLALGALEQAEREIQIAIEITSANHSMKAFAYAVMAQVLLRAGRPVEALAAASRGKDLLDTMGTMEDGDALVRLVFAEALHANGDIDTARAALSAAHDSILRDAETIRDDEMRHSFLHNIPEHARILELARAWAVTAS
jgi:ATP/maltotriose-dependent transcriptional regulator MalT